MAIVLGCIAALVATAGRRITLEHRLGLPTAGNAGFEVSVCALSQSQPKRGVGRGVGRGGTVWTLAEPGCCRLVLPLLQAFQIGSQHYIATANFW